MYDCKVPSPNTGFVPNAGVAFLNKKRKKDVDERTHDNIQYRRGNKKHLGINL